MALTYFALKCFSLHSFKASQMNFYMPACWDCMCKTEIMLSIIGPFWPLFFLFYLKIKKVPKISKIQKTKA